MTSIVEASDRVVGLARGMRELVAGEAAESERMRTTQPGDRRRDVVVAG